LASDITGILTEAVLLQASDIYMVAGRPLTYKVRGNMTIPEAGEKLDPDATESMIKAIYLEGGRDLSDFLQKGDDDFSFSIPGVARFRVGAYKQRSSMAAVIRVVQFALPDPRTIGIPDAVVKLSELTKGLVLVTGPGGSGKSTTLACIIDYINKTRSEHIITLEDPLEYLHRHDLSIVSQREISTDTESYEVALRAALRHSPDVILLGEMRDPETIALALSAAESGRLVISSLYTVDAANTIERIIEAFPPSQQYQVRIQLSAVLQAVVSQQLLPTVDGKIATAFELMLTSSEIRQLIRESRIREIGRVLQSYAQNPDPKMYAMDDFIFKLLIDGVIEECTAMEHSTDPDRMGELLRREH
jgi:twitching motility protein PilT